MNWTQITNPLHNAAFSALLAILPVLFIFWALIIRKMKGYQASLGAIGLTILIVVFGYGMPVQMAVLSAANGALYGLFPICWILVSAVFLFNVNVASGQFEIIRYAMASITPDRRLQAILIAFSFGSFLEGTAGFGAPVAITSAMLVGLGFQPLYAAGLCLIANTAPVAFGSIGIPITVVSQVTAIPEMAISQMVGRTLPILSFILPFYLVMLIAGFRKTLEVLPAILVSGGSFALIQFLSSNYAGPALPDILAGIGSIVCLIVFLKYWKPGTVWRFEHEPVTAVLPDKQYSGLEIFRAGSSFILLTVIIIAWGLQPVKNLLNSIGMIQFEFPGLHNIILDQAQKPIPHIFKFNYLSAAGTAIFLAAIISVPLLNLGFRKAIRVFSDTLSQLSFAIISVASVLGFAYLINDSGMAITMAEALARTGSFFPFFAPVLGWLGVFITGSDTSANALFGKIQSATAVSIQVDPVVTVAANVSGGVVGKMISPQSIAVAAAAGNLVGKESSLFRFTVKHSFILLLCICCIVFVQAYICQWLIPEYQIAGSTVAKPAADHSEGYAYLIGLAVLIAIITIAIRFQNKKHLK